MKERSIEFDDSWDVIVVGGGPAGCTAATASAREGARTLLIEGTGCLGGMGTSGLVPAWCPFSDKEKIIYKGLAERVFNEVKKGMAHVDENAMNWVPIDPELLKRVYDDMVTDAGVTVLFNTMLCDVEMKLKGEVATLIMSNKSGLKAYKAKVYVDCTGDADLSFWAGAEFIKGDETTGDLQPASHCFILSNVDEYGFKNGPRTHPSDPMSPIHAIQASGKYPLIPDKHTCSALIGPRTVGFNAGHLWNVDNTNPESTSNALMLGRKIAASFREALAEYNPKAFSNSFLVATGSLMGIRETRRIIGDYILTVDDYLDRRSFDDEICRNSYYIDIHNNVDEGVKAKQENFDSDARYERYKKGESHGVPYRCLTPKGLKNVLVAGRSISCDRPVQGSVRVMPVCLAMGEAAGIAAAHSIKSDKIDVHAIDTEYLRRRLKEEGAYIN